MGSEVDFSSKLHQPREDTSITETRFADKSEAWGVVLGSFSTMQRQADSKLSGLSLNAVERIHAEYGATTCIFRESY